MFHAPGSLLSVIPHTYAMIMVIYSINMDIYVSDLQTESQNEEGEQWPCWLIEYS